MKKFSHTNDKGHASMVDVGTKPIQHRRAIASGKIILSAETISLIRDNQMKKGDVLSISEFAGIMAAKQTSQLIPLCHPLLLSDIQVKAEIVDDGILISSSIKCSGQTGVEMEALTSVSIALLTIYDMCKAVDKTMVLGDIRLLEKIKENNTDVCIKVE